MVRQGLRGLISLTDDFEVIGEAANGPAAFKPAEELVPDMIIIDLLVPEMDGVAAVKALKSISPRSRIMALEHFSFFSFFNDS